MQSATSSFVGMSINNLPSLSKSEANHTKVFVKCCAGSGGNDSRFQSPPATNHSSIEESKTRGSSSECTVLPFDGVFDSQVTDTEVFEAAIKPLVENALLGHSATVFIADSSNPSEEVSNSFDSMNTIIQKSVECLLKSNSTPSKSTQCSSTDLNAAGTIPAGGMLDLGLSSDSFGDTSILHSSAHDSQHQQITTDVVWQQPSSANGFTPAEPYTPLVHVNGSTYYVWVDVAQRAWVTQITAGQAVTIPLDSNPDYLVQADGHHRFSLGVDKTGIIHVTGDMHHYSTFSEHVITPYPARYQRQGILYWRSNQPFHVGGGFWFAGTHQSPSTIPGGGWMLGRFFNDNFGELYYSSMTHAYEAPSHRNHGQMAVGLYRLDAVKQTWTAIGGKADTPDDPYLSHVATVFYWENSGMNGGWFQNYQARFVFDQNNRLHFAVTGNTNSNYGGADRVIYAVSDDGGLTWKKASGTRIPGLPLRGVDGNPNVADIVADCGSASYFPATPGLVVDRNGRPAVAAEGQQSNVPTWFLFDGSRWTSQTKLNDAIPWGTPKFAYQTATNDLLLVQPGVSIVLRSVNFDSPSYAYGFQPTGTLATPDERTLKTSGELYAVVAPTATPTSDGKPSGPPPPTIITKTTFSVAPLPDGWKDVNITKRNLAYGTASSFNGSTFSHYDFGKGLGTDDDMHFTHMQLNGDGEFVARLSASRIPVPGKPEAGIMMRDSNDPAARFIAVSADINNGTAKLLARSSPNGWPVATPAAGLHHAIYLQLVRCGDTFTAAISADGKQWNTIGQSTQPMSQNILVGLFSSANQHGYYMQSATFDEVEIISPAGCVFKSAEASKVQSQVSRAVTMHSSPSNGIPITSVDDVTNYFKRLQQGVTRSDWQQSTKVSCAFNLQIHRKGRQDTTKALQVDSKVSFVYLPEAALQRFNQYREQSLLEGSQSVVFALVSPLSLQSNSTQNFLIDLSLNFRPPIGSSNIK